MTYTPVGVNINSGTATDTHVWNQAFNMIYYQRNGDGATCGTSTCSNSNIWGTFNDQYEEQSGLFKVPGKVQYVWPRIIPDATVPSNTIIVTNQWASGTTDETFTTLHPSWATNIETTPTNTWVTINNADIYETTDAVNSAYHYLLRFVQGQGSKAAQRKATYRSKLKAQMEPFEKHRGDKMADFYNVKENEIVALQLLKSMLSSERWKKYLKYGFVDVQARSGLIYQIGRGQHHVKVFRQGENIADLCVGLKNRYNMPPTDEVITRMIIVECDEPDIWARANAHGFRGQKPKTEEDLARIVLQKAA